MARTEPTRALRVLRGGVVDDFRRPKPHPDWRGGVSRLPAQPLKGLSIHTLELPGACFSEVATRTLGGSLRMVARHDIEMRRGAKSTRYYRIVE